METGKSKKLEALCEDIKEGKTDKAELFDKYGATYLRVYRGVDHCITLANKPKAYERPNKPINQIWFGKAGSGKTYDAEQQAIDGQYSLFKLPISQLRKGWYDGYAGEDIILFDDFRGSSMEPHEFLNLLDGLPRLACKGGHLVNKARFLFFTSPDHPINWWPKWYAKDENNWAQVKRRLGDVYHCDDQKYTKTDNNDCSFYKNEIETVKVH